MEITLTVPDDINEEAFKEFAMVFVKRHLAAKQAEEHQKVEDAITMELDKVRESNDLKTSVEIAADYQAEGEALNKIPQ